jgi:hypothetical protein
MMKLLACGVQSANKIYPTRKPTFTQQRKSEDGSAGYFAGGVPGRTRTCDLRIRNPLLLSS